MHRASGAIELLLACVSCGLWSFGYILEIVVPNFADKLFWSKFEYLGIATVSVWVLLFVIHYSGQATRPGPRLIAGLLAIPTLTILCAATNELHSWMWTSEALQPGWPAAPLALGHGWWFWVNIAYSYLLLVGATAMLVQFVIRAPRLYRTQALIMLGATLAPWLGNALYILGVRPGPNLDLTPLAFTLTNIGLTIGFVRFRLLDILPVAFPSIFQVMGDGVIVLDGRDRIVGINPAAKRIFQRVVSQSKTQPVPHNPRAYDPFISRPITDLVAGWKNPTQAAGGFENQEFQIQPEFGNEELIYQLNSTPILDRQKQITGQVLIFTDITHIKRAEDQMRLLVTALESAENGIVITDPKGCIEWANPAFSRLIGYPLEEVIGQNPRIIKSGLQPEAYYKDMWDTILAGKVWRGEIVNRRKDGALYHEEMTITPLSGPGGRITHFIAIKQDITQRKLAEEQLKIAHEAALESNRLKTRLLANVSHDIRTPLGAIIGYSDMLAEGVFGEISPDQKQAVADIQDSSNQLLMFVNNLIGQAQFDSGKVVVKAKPFTVQELVEACQSMLSMTAAKKGLQLDYEIDPFMPHTLVGDIYWLRQIVLNLVNNALKFTDKGSVKLCISSPDPQTWTIEVSDTGIGIPTESQQAIFEPFRKAEEPHVAERSGSGLGLLIVKDLTALMGGQISLKSQPGVGSQFTVSFPLKVEGAA